MAIVVAVDTSGSVSQTEMDEFISELYGILNSISRMKLILIPCDAAIQGVYTFEDGESIDGTPMPWNGLEFKGGGGTRFEPVFEYVNQFLQPDLLVYFTDGYGSYPSEESINFPVIWVMTNRTHPEVSVGSVIYFNNLDQNQFE